MNGSELQLEQVRRIIVRAPNWIGDVVMSLPALRRLRQVFPNAYITVVTRTSSADLFIDDRSIDEVLRQDNVGWLSIWQHSRRWRSGNFDLALLLQNAFQAAVVAFLARIPVRVGYGMERRGALLTHAIPPPPWKNDRHEIYYYLNLVHAVERLVRGEADADKAAPDFKLAISKERRRAAFEIVRRYGFRDGAPLVLLCPGSINSRAKRWPAEYYATLANLLAEYGAQVALIGSPSELEVSDRVLARTRHKPMILTGKTTVAEIVSLISIADILITNDTGPAHIGSAAGTPTLVIFGPTNPDTTRPFAPASEIIRHPPDCAPCMLRDCPIDHRCMTAIQPDEVFARARHLLSRHPAEVIA